VKTRKRCNVRFRSDAIYIISLSDTPFGMFANVPFTKLKTDVEPVLLGTTILALLRSIPDRSADINLPNWRNNYKEYLKSLGFKTDNAFEKSSVLLSVELEEQKIAITPYESVSGGGSTPLDDKRGYSAAEPDGLGMLMFEQFKALRSV
jgi:hypothetical protein